ncbi:MAG TPA: extracellular solute-binding protein [Ktedonobacteraceae bacterium]|jgi:molybdate/tungstate transport system substrate-binding protein|nr:extracellular solute-binding protein [Ktedonobacteraceae bacterium]
MEDRSISPTRAGRLKGAGGWLACICLFALLVSACGSSATTTSATGTKTAAKGSGTVQVMYAASLVNVMENEVKTAFHQDTGYTFEGEGKGSLALANEIKGHLHRPDVFISASPGVNTQLMGSANGNFVSWYLNFARSEMVIGYSKQSRFAADFQAAANGSKSWYEVLEEPGLRLGRTDPLLDPKGQATLYLMQLAETYYKQPGLQAKILGADENTAQIFPEEGLVTRLDTGQLDAGFFYLSEAKQGNISFISLPEQINLGNPALASTYSAAHWTNPKTKATSKGAPIVYTITIPSTTQNQAGATAFVAFLLSSQGQAILQGAGLSTTPFKLTGDSGSLPAALQQYVQS